MDLITLRAGRGELFRDDHDTMRFLLRAQRLGQERGIRVVAWRFEPNKAELLGYGGREQHGEWLRVLRASHSLTRGIPGGFKWAHLGQQTVTLETALAHLHVLPFCALDCSLWDATGLRHRGLDVGLLRLRAPAWHYALAGLSEPPSPPRELPFAPWNRLLQVLRFVTGRGGGERCNSVLLTQLALLVGWELEAIAALRGVTADAVRKNLRQPSRPELEACLIWLFEPRFPGVEGLAQSRRRTGSPSSSLKSLSSSGSMGSPVSLSSH